MDLGVVVEDHAGIEDAVGVEQVLDAPHHGIGPLAPLVAHERGHVSARPVLRLEGAVVLPHHEEDELAHEGGVAPHGGGVREVLGEDEVEVAVAGVAEGDGVREIVPGVEDLEVGDGLGQALHGDHDVLDDDRGARGADVAHGGEQALAQAPVPVPLRGLGGEHGRGEQAHAGEHVLRAADERRHRLGAVGAELHEQRRRPRADGEGIAPLALLRPQRGGVHDLEGSRPPGHQGRHRRSRLGQLGEEEQRGGAMARLRHRAQGGIGHEPERAFRAHHEVGEDLGGRVVVEQGVQAVAGRVLARELGADPRRQRAVRPHLVAQGQEPAVEVRTIVAEALVGARRRRVHLRAVREQEMERVEGVVAVLGHAAAHARGVVGDDPAHHAGVDGGRIGTEAAVQGPQQPIEVPAHHARLRPHAVPAVEHSGRAPERGQLHEDVVGHGLAGQGRPRRAQREVPSVCPRVGQERAHLGEVPGPHDRLGDEPIDGGVHRARHEVEGTREHALGREQPAQVGDEIRLGGGHRGGYGEAGAPTGTRKR